MKKRRFSAFTLVELLIAMIIIGILGTIGISQFQGIMISMRMPELYETVNAIIKAEELFYLENGFYAAADDGRPGNDLAYNDGAAFETYLGITIPTTAKNSNFLYGVYYGELYRPPTRIFVRVASQPWDPPDYNLICFICLHDGGDYVKGTWRIYTNNPWSKYLKPPIDESLIVRSP